MVAKKIFTNIRILILIAVIILAIVAIHPKINTEGATIRSVTKLSAADIAGIKSPKPSLAPSNREIILAVNNYPVKSPKDYYDATAELYINQTITIRTNKAVYALKVIPKTNLTQITDKNGTNQTTETIIGVQDIGLKVDEVQSTNIRKGLDLQGGTRIILQPEETLSEDNLSYVIESMKQRLNVYGLSDVTIRSVKDSPIGGEAKQFILVEIAGSSEEEVKNLVAKQGKFEAKVGQKTVFMGGQDITYVCRTAECSGIDPRVGCGKSQDGFVCRFIFTIRLDGEAAKRQAQATKELLVIDKDGQSYLNETLDLYLDNSLVDSLSIGADLRGSDVQNIQISGSGSGRTQSEAMQNAIANMKELQTVLVTGSLPVKIDIVKTDSLSPTLGKEFSKNALLVGALAILAVSIVILLRYHNILISMSVVITMAAEILILLGFGALVGWEMDIAALAGLIVASGTGVDDQIVITDETLGRRKKDEAGTNWMSGLKNAFFIIFAAFFVTIAAMVPLLFAGAGMLKGFALTTIMGVIIGVFITRPAYAEFIKIITNK